MVFAIVIKSTDDKVTLRFMTGESTGKVEEIDKPTELKLKKYNIVTYEAGALELYALKKDIERKTLTEGKGVFGIVESYNVKKGFGFIRLFPESGEEVSQYVHFTGIESGDNFAKLFRYEPVYVDIEVISEGTHSGKSQCVGVRGAAGKLRCQIKRNAVAPAPPSDDER